MISPNAKTLQNSAGDFTFRERSVSVTSTGVLFFPANIQRIGFSISNVIVGNELFIGWSQAFILAGGLRIIPQSPGKVWTYAEIGANVGFEIYARVGTGPTTVYGIEFIYQPRLVQ